MATVHLILETIKLYLGSKASKTSLQDYMVVNYSARQGWIPQRDVFFDKIDSENKEENTIEFDKLEAKVCGCGYSIIFELSNFSIE